MMRKITSGDVVVLHYRDRVVLREAVKVVHTPGGAGDLWQFQRADGGVFAINPYCSTFERMERLDGITEVTDLSEI